MLFFSKTTVKAHYGKNLNLYEYNKLRLLYVYYATANRNPKQVSAWQELCVALYSEGIFEKIMFDSKKDLIKKSLIIKKPNYQSELYRKHIEDIKNNFKNKNELG
ncbi:MAG: hypothetical protein OEM18_02510 [Nitrosopumilus sp.]|nr:hypothetical protein [Nitrosopumilus sp.]